MVSILTACYISKYFTYYSELPLRFTLMYRRNEEITESTLQLQERATLIFRRNAVLKEELDYLSIGDSTFAKLNIEELEKLEGILLSDEKFYWAKKGLTM